MREQQVVLVNEQDEDVGTIGKTEAHQKGLLHRAFSIFIFDNGGKMLLQKRSSEKYHGGNLWTNACCSHPFPDESVEAAAQRRLKEELGFTTALHEIFSFIYHAEVENDLIEHEFDHVLAGEYNDEVQPNRHEVADYGFESMKKIKEDMASSPEKFTSWFKIAFPKIEEWWQVEYGER